jgi:two-component system, LytTR family, sensor kinase
MSVLISYQDPLLINTIGHAVGALLFAVLAALLFKDGRRSSNRQTRLSLMAAVLALFWNLGSLLVLAASGRDSRMLEAVVSFSFSVLSLLPAVLLHLVLRQRKRALVIAGYGVCFVAVFLHVLELALTPFQLHQWALLLISVGLSAVIFIAWVADFRRRVKQPILNSELLSLACLWLFSVSFVHFGYGHAASAWTAEIAWHHAGIPLVLFVLLQDYRFLLLDVFLRFLVNFGLAAAYAVVAFAVNQRFHLWALVVGSEFYLGLGIVALCLALISFAWVRSFSQSWLTSRFFRRSDTDLCTRRLSAAVAGTQTEEALMQECAAALANCLATARFSIRTITTPFLDRPVITATASSYLPGDLGWVEAVVPLRFSRGDGCQILLGGRLGGRRYLSEDLDTLRHFSALIVEQVERFRSETMQRLIGEAEFRALQSQINPHFLFNALNTLYGTIDRKSEQARRFVLNLADIFRYFLQTDRTFISLGEELKIVQAYLEIEQLRLGDRLETVISVPDSLLPRLIPILSLQPLVENAVKHGVARQQGKGSVKIIISETPPGLLIKVQDSGPGFSADHSGAENGTGIGLENVRQRLRLCYGDVARLRIESDSTGTVVSFLIPHTDSPLVRPLPVSRSSSEAARLS